VIWGMAALTPDPSALTPDPSPNPGRGEVYSPALAPGPSPNPGRGEVALVHLDSHGAIIH
jgi:hypothetical protein